MQAFTCLCSHAERGLLPAPSHLGVLVLHPAVTLLGRTAPTAHHSKNLPCFRTLTSVDEAKVTGETPVVINTSKAQDHSLMDKKKCGIHRKEEWGPFNEKLGIAGWRRFMLKPAVGQLPSKAGRGLVLATNSAPCPKTRHHGHSLGCWRGAVCGL